jgi:predicted nucleic acid-binding protein
MTERLAEDALRFVKKGLTGYDACYASLAKQLKGRWLTFDEKAHRQVRREGISHLLKRGLPKGWT